MIMSWNYKWCMGFGYEHDAVDLNLYVRNSFMKCSKTIWYDFCQTYNIWRGPEAVWFDNCSQTTMLNVDLTTWNYYSKLSRNIWMGSLSAKSPNSCRTLPLIGKGGANDDSTLTKYAKMSYDRYLDYFWNKTASDEKLNGTVQEIPSITAAVKSYLF